MIVSGFALEAAHLRCRVYVEWVPTKANVADGVSRMGELDPWCAGRGLQVERLRLPRWLPHLGANLALWREVFGNRPE